jgi:amyloid beta precursor protein binding protein 1
MGPLSLIPIYLALHATSHVFHPASSEQILAQVGRLVPGADENKRVVEAAEEVARAGMVAQEVIKIITKQYIPIDNTCVFDGIGSRCQVVRL